MGRSEDAGARADLVLAAAEGLFEAARSANVGSDDPRRPPQLLGDEVEQVLAEPLRADLLDEGLVGVARTLVTGEAPAIAELDRRARSGRERRQRSGARGPTRAKQKGHGAVAHGRIATARVGGADKDRAGT